MFDLGPRKSQFAVASFGIGWDASDPIQRVIGVFGVRVAVAFSIFAMLVALR
jgi:hypothetical protein